ncbi:MAG: YiiX/YebB-like N1pC/P60 family cysteine hydrolase [Pseudomonadota bacterium]
MPTQRYATLRRRLKTGDLVFFAGRGLLSDSVKAVTDSRWSHVAMVMVLPEYDFVCLWESTALSNLKDLNIGRTHEGVQLVPLSTRLRTYEGDMALRQLCGVRLSRRDMQKLMALRRKLGGRPYEASTLELMAAAYDGLLGEQQENLSSLFCSELVAETYQALGLIRGGRKDKPSNEYTPADFAETTESLPWIRGHLGPEIRLKL